MTATDSPTFADEWNSLDRGDRGYLRRMARVGKLPDDERLAELAPAYARFQMARPRMRFFWYWFAAGVFVALGAAASIHPLVLGVCLALGAQAVWAWFSLRKLARMP